MSDLKVTLADLWRELLKIEEVTEDTDFFDAGGTSIVAVYLAAEIQERFGAAVDAVDVVTYPRFADLSGLVEEKLAGTAL
ncbi:acyl carrier protein [Streptomyces sp. NPDC044780]|uniref:Acyl carrier protein n=1 Tax=Streptomyces luomodiensis TaxID=3026192 RepID=A0ABY9VBM6_9ACTN|nr:acyl carrier protein [Streptomyces sp. SCA4-21]WNF01044.1 acyl carrier protein [Streptomyces sp. SCA4-21]